MSKRHESPARPRVAVYCPHLGGGGAEQVALAQLDILIAAGYGVDLLLNEAGGHYSRRVPECVRVVPFVPAGTAAIAVCRNRALRGHPWLRLRTRFMSPNRLTDLRYMPGFVDYLEREQPLLVIANVWHIVLIATCARACVAHPPRVIGVFHSAFFAEAIQRRSARRHPWQWRNFFAFCRHFYRQADALVTVSNGIARDLTDIVGVDANRVETLPNPVVSPALTAKAAEPVFHPWLVAGAPPLVVAVGRLSPEKNYPLLLRALAHLRVSHPEARLAILGEGEERVRLEVLRDELGLTDCVLLPGWVDNPHAWMRRSSLVALSSQWEGLSMVLIEALACGCSVVATDCPHGPREVLDNGRYGRLVPLNDPWSFARAMAETIDAPSDGQAARAHTQRYSFEAATQRYRALLDRVLASPE